MTVLRTLDMHAHIDPSIAASELSALNAFVIAMTRSGREFAEAVQRNDQRVLWARGVHPGLAREHKNFSVELFRRDLARTAAVGEVGLDGTSRVPMNLQVANFRLILSELSESPRIVSVHSFEAELQVLRELHRTWVPGVVLHWWTGSAELTEEAIRLGCWFSLPPGAMGNPKLLDLIPLNRLLPETDHPYGDRRGPRPRLPGAVGEVESKVGQVHGMHRRDVRELFWANFLELARQTRVLPMLPKAWRETVSA